MSNLVETYLGVYIGAVTFSGSVVACGKLNENIRSQPLIIGPGSSRHLMNLLVLIVSAWLLYVFCTTAHVAALIFATILALALGWHLVMAIGGADMPVVVSMLSNFKYFSIYFYGHRLY